MREEISMDSGWRFHLGDFTETRNRWAFGKSGSWNQGPESIGYDDSGWREVNVPHDFVIEGEPKPYLVNEFDSKDNAIPEMQSVNNMHTTAGSFVKDVGWYRKHFFIPGEDLGRKIYFIFDGIYRDSSIWLNNFFIQKHLSGYTGIVCDITDFVNYGGDNVIAVRCDARQPEGWFYEGGGIYRHARLLKVEKVHIDTVFVSARVNLEDKSAAVVIKTDAQKAVSLKEHELGGGCPTQREHWKNIRLVSRIIGPDGECAAQLETALAEGSCQKDGMVRNAQQDGSRLTPGMSVQYGTGSPANITVSQNTVLKEIHLWDVDSPKMYRAECRLYSGGLLLDEYTADFGIRDIRFDADRGFYLNGKNIKLKGVCCHQNHGGLGTALPDEIYAYRIGKLKEMGCNAYRTSHYPPSPALLDICDRMGMLVMDETRLLSSAGEDLEQLEFMVRRDRNHPSVILYSIGNEEAQSQTTPQGGRIAAAMMEHIRALDDTRPVTMGLLMWDLANRRPIENISEIAGISEHLDVAGFNYHEHRWEEFHKRYPNQPMICTEQGTFKSTRGCCETDAAKCHLAITDRTADSYMKGAAQWHAARAPYMSGLFLWTGFDYYGEPTPYAWPAVSSQFGIMDLCGYPKDFYYYYKAWWSGETVLHIFPHWNGNVGTSRDVHVFSNCREVELFLNGRSLGRQTMETDSFLVWQNVEYEPGVLSAKGYDEAGAVMMEREVKTTGPAAQVRLSKDFQKNGIVVIKAEIVDEDERFVPDACVELSFSIEGQAVLLGASNGDPSDHTPVRSHVRRAFNGMAQLIVRLEGEAAVKAWADGIEGNVLQISPQE